MQRLATQRGRNPWESPDNSCPYSMVKNSARCGRAPDANDSKGQARINSGSSKRCRVLSLPHTLSAGWTFGDQRGPLTLSNGPSYTELAVATRIATCEDRYPDGAGRTRGT